VPEKGTFLTCGDDNTIYEFSISKKQMVKQGKVWTAELFGGKPYETTKIKSDETQPEDIVIPAGGVHPGIIGGDSDVQKSAAENARKEEETRSNEFNKK